MFKTKITIEEYSKQVDELFDKNKNTSVGETLIDLAIWCSQYPITNEKRKSNSV